MKFDRRSFMKLAGSGAACLTLGQLGVSLTPIKAYAEEIKISGAKEVVTVCPFCSVSCHVIGHVKNGKLVNTEGDPDYPINEGALCAKGAAMFSMTTSHHRLQKPLYRAPYSDKWEEKSWDWMLDVSHGASRTLATRILSSRTRRAIRSTDLSPCSCWAPPMQATKNVRLLIRQCAAWVLSTWTTRHVSDTAQLLRLWESRSDAVR